MVWAIMSLKRTAAKKIFVTAAKNNRHRKRKYFADLKTKKNYCRRIFLPFISAAVALAPARSEAEVFIFTRDHYFSVGVSVLVANKIK